MKKPFDPFDEMNRDRRKKRSRSEVAFEKEQRKERVLNHYKRALENLGMADYVTWEEVKNQFEFDPEATLSVESLRRISVVAMDEIGYLRMDNPNSKDGRWKINGVFVTVYVNKNAQKVGGISELKKLIDV